MRRHLLTFAAASLLLCGILFAGCASTNYGSGTGTPTPSMTGAPATGAGGVSSTGTVATSPSATTTATSGVATPTITPRQDGTFAFAGNGSITGTKFNDLNAGHRRDPGEPGLTGWTIVLETRKQSGATWTEVRRTTTDGLGAYVFSNLSAGDYRVSESAQQDWTQTFPTERDGMTELTVSIDRTFWDGVDFGNTGGPATTSTTGGTVTSTGTATMGSTAASVAPTASGTAAATTTLATTPSATAAAIVVPLTAQDLKFDKSTITVSAGAQVTINFNNKDSGVPHNFALYIDSSASTSIYKGAIVTGPATATYTFAAPSTPGTYFFRCDVHPTQMSGQFIVQ